MFEELDEFFGRALVEALCEEGLYFSDLGLGSLLGVFEYEDGAEFVSLPATGEVTDVNLAVVAELNVKPPPRRLRR